ncbi:MAG: M28 family peptidase, partial [Acidobacteria bacterium]|nr:M28 family peptidase [Acidobacteriota bacterium]
MAKTRIGAAAIFTFVCVVGLSLAAVLLGGPPAPVPASAAATEFSAERAMVYVRAIAERPHPMGSVDHARVRDYLVKTIEGLGVAVERQDATIVRSVAAGVRIGRVENLLVRLKGTASTGAVLLATHYDSVPAAPGAADAGSGVAALIETLRALKAGYPLRNDLIVLLTDGEEFGLLGAAAFAEQHPWAKDVRLALNFEARGTSGPAQMFETGPENGAVVRAWAAAMPRPTGSSLSYEVYKRMPNDTDFSIFRKLPVVGLNFSFVGGWEDYHTPHDAPAALDRGSLQHHGSAALSLARRFGGIDLTAVRGRDAVYFSLPIVNKAVVYSTLWALPLAVLAVVLFLWAFILSRGRKETSIGGLILAVVVVALFGAAAGYFGWRFGRLVELLHQSWLPEGNVLQSAPYGALLVATIITVWCALYVVLRKKFAAHTLAYGSIVLWVAAGVAAAWFLPGGSYVVLWPVLSAVLTAVVLATSGRAESPGGFRVLLACVLAVPAALVIWPLDAALFGTMGLSPESGAGMALMTVYGLGALALSIELITEGRRWWPAGLAFAVTLVCLGLGGALTHYSDEHPRIVNVYYVLDAHAKPARWTARVSRMDSRIETYVGAHPAEG